jgi:hypothetical protein
MAGIVIWPLDTGFEQDKSQLNRVPIDRYETIRSTFLACMLIRGFK